MYLNMRPLNRGLSLCVKDDVFNFDGKVCVHRNRVAMCSLPSPVLSNYYTIKSEVEVGFRSLGVELYQCSR